MEQQGTREHFMKADLGEAAHRALVPGSCCCFVTHITQRRFGLNVMARTSTNERTDTIARGDCGAGGAAHGGQPECNAAGKMAPERGQ